MAFARPQLFDGNKDSAPEWSVVQEVVAASLAREPAAWDSFALCRTIEIYTDGSAPIRNPGGPAGFAAIVLGFAGQVEADRPPPAPLARLDLGGSLPARTDPPATSNNRAELAGVLAALHALETIGRRGSAAHRLTIWSDSSYVVNCAGGQWQRKKNTDLWPIYDLALQAVATFWKEEVALTWLKGHASNIYNEAADELATRAALGFDRAAYLQYRAAQASSAREMPGAAALRQVEQTLTRADTDRRSTQPAADAEAPARTPIPWALDTDYLLVLHTQLEGRELRGAAQGRYCLVTRKGQSRDVTIRHAGPHAIDEAEYLTLIAALTDLSKRIKDAGRQPASYTVSVLTHQELVVKQINGAYRVKAAALQAPYAAACGLIQQFARVDLTWKPAQELKPLFEP